MIAITNTLRDLYFSRNAVPVTLDLSDYVTTPGVLTERRLLFPGATEAGDSFTISWTVDGVDYEVTVTVASPADAEEYEMIPGSGSNYAQQVVNLLRSIPLIWQFFDVYFAQQADPDRFGFGLRARQPGDIDLGTTSSGFTWVVPLNTTGALPVVKTDYLGSLWVAIAPEHDTARHNFIRLGEMEVLPDAHGVAHLDVSEILDAFFEQPEQPTSTTGEPVLCTAIQRPFHLMAGHKWGDPLERRVQVETSVLNVIKGGLSPHDFASLSSGAITYANAHFLTLRTQRDIDASQLDWLYYYGMTLGPTTELALEAAIVYTDGTTATPYLWDTTDVQSGKVYQLAAGYTASGVQAIAEAAEKRVRSYSLRLWSRSTETPDRTLLRGPVTFHLLQPDYLSVHMEYENTLGAIEGWLMRGVRAYTGRTGHSPYRVLRTRPADSEGAAAVSFQELLSYNERDELSLTLSTGPMSRSEAHAFRDFLRTRHRWLRIGTHRIPVYIDPGTYQLDRETLDADYTREHTFQATLPPSLGVSDIIPLFS